MHIDFPFAGDGIVGEARVVRWSSPRELDVATLLLTSPLLIEPATLWMGPPPEKNTKAEVFGYPNGALDGVWADVTVSRRLSVASVQLNNRTVAGAEVVEGYSGSPVWAKRKGQLVIVGMIVKTARKVHASSFVPAPEMSGQLMLNQQVKGSLGWSLKVFRSTGLSHFLADLRKLRLTGVPDEDTCLFVQEQLEIMEVSLGGLTDTTLWPCSPYDHMTKILASYRAWNDANRDSSGASARDLHMGEIMKERSEISEKLRTARGTIELYEDLEAEAGNLLGALAALGNRYPNTFVRLNQLMANPYAA